MFFLGQGVAGTVRANNGAVEALNQRCDPAPLVRLAGHQERWTGRGKYLYSLLLVNSMEALLAAGLEEAVIGAARQMLALAPPPPQSDPFSCTWQLFLSRGCTQLEHWDEAIEAQNRAMEHFGRCDAKAQREFSWYLSLNGYTLQLHAGALEGLEGRCQTLLDTAYNLKTQVEAHFLLGRLYLAADRGAEAVPHLEYAADQGNGLLCRREAQVLLARLPGESLTAEQLCFTAERAMDGGRLSQAAEQFQQARQTGEPLQPVHQLNWAAALLNLGRFQEALDLLENLELPRSLQDRDRAQLNLLHQLTLAYAGLGRLEEATQRQNEAVALFEKAGAELWRTPLWLSGVRLRLLLGELEGVEEELSSILNTKFHIGLDFLSAHIRMAEYLLATGRGEEARPHLEYVTAHAGEHFYGRQAQRALETL